MSRTHDQLATLVELRERERDDAERGVAAALGRVDEIRQAIRQRETELADVRRRAFEAGSTIAATDLAGRQRADEFRRALKVEAEELQAHLDDCHDRLRSAESELEDARETFTEREAALRAVQTRLEAHERATETLRARRAEAEQDEIALRRWKEEHE